MRNAGSITRDRQTLRAACPGLSCRNRILRWITPQVRNRDDAEDVVGEICLHCMRGLKQFRGEAEFETWLFRIVRNVLNDFLRAKHLRKEADATIGGDNIESLRSSGASLADAVVENERVRAALCRLTPRQRHLIEWKYGDGLTYGEIANRLLISETAVSQALYRARGAFAKAFEDPPNENSETASNE